MPNNGSILRPGSDYKRRQDYKTNNSKLPDLTDLPIRYEGHPKYNRREILVTDPVETIVQKLELLLLTNTGEVIGEPEYGGNIEYLLWQTDVAVDVIESDLNSQISRFIPELNQIGYTLEAQLFEGEYRDILNLNFTIQGQNYLYLWA